MSVVLETAVVGQVFEAKHQPGTAAYGSRMMLDVLQQTCGQLARNGFKKIVLVNGHGGNDPFLRFVRQSRWGCGATTSSIEEVLQRRDRPLETKPSVKK